MKKVVLMFIFALICGVMITNCKRAEQKVNLALASEDIAAFNVTDKFVLADREKDEIVSRDISNIEDIEKWIRDERQKKMSNIANTEDIEKWIRDERQKRMSNIANTEDIEKWIRDERQKKSNIVE